MRNYRTSKARTALCHHLRRETADAVSLVAADKNSDEQERGQKGRSLLIQLY